MISELRIRMAIPHLGVLLLCLSHPVTVVSWAEEPTIVASPLFKTHHPRPVGSVLLLGPGEMVVTSCLDGRLRFFDVKKGTQHAQVFLGDVGHVTPICAASDGKKIYAALDTSVEAWDTKEGKRLWRKEFVELDSGIVDIALAPDSTTLAVQCLRKHSFLLDAQTGKQLNRSSHPDKFFTGCVFSKDSKRLLVTCDSEISILNAASLDIERKIKRRATDELHGSAWSPDEKIIATVSDDRRVRLWDVERGELQHSFIAQEDTPLHIRFLDKDTILTVDNKGYVTQWSISQKKMVRRVKCAPDEITDLAISPGSKRIAIACVNGDVAVYDVEKR